MKLNFFKKYLLIIFFSVGFIIYLICFVKKSNNEFLLESKSGQIILYGEKKHAKKHILDKELKIWINYYNNYDMRDLFIETPYYTAEFLNIWMKSDNDDILSNLYKDWFGTANYSLDVINFYKQIKKECPKTVFHGTDVGHQYDSTGKRFLEYLESIGQRKSDLYKNTLKSINQGIYYYDNNCDNVFRENKMVENFILEYNKLGTKNIMGIYGVAHTKIGAFDFYNKVENMATQLYKKYKDNLHYIDLS